MIKRMFRLLVAIGLLVSLSTATHGGEGESGEAVAVFAGGCFWCMEPPFDAVDGVQSTTSGYTGGHLKNPTYEQVTGEDTGHYEAVRIVYDPDRVSYEELLYVLWRNIDPLDAGGQFCDRGDSYRAAIFYRNDEERVLAEESRDAVAEQLGDEVVTEILPADTFYDAEDYHQNYYQENPLRYRFYRSRCGRDSRLEELWGAEAGG